MRNVLDLGIYQEGPPMTYDPHSSLGLEEEVERVLDLSIRVSVGADPDGTLTAELERRSVRINSLSAAERERAARAHENLAVALGIALREATGSLDAVSKVIREHWAKD